MASGEGFLMRTSTDCTSRADECRRLAKLAAQPEDWQHFLEMATTWDMLAEQRKADEQVNEQVANEQVADGQVADEQVTDEQAADEQLAAVLVLADDIANGRTPASLAENQKSECAGP
jgi:hypothetical protein